VQLSYAIGVAEPTSVYVDCQGTANVPEEAIEAAIIDVFPLTPKGIIDTLKLKRPIYESTAYHGHFGRTPGADGSFSWERTDRVDALKAAATADAQAS
jgi:S-adenosylmethionine synthetase